MSAYDRVTNGSEIVERFGRWPSFHDCEVVRVSIDRTGPAAPRAEMVIHAWLMTSEVDGRGYYVLEKHSLVTFSFEQLLSSEFVGFNDQNCLSSLSIEEESLEDGVALRVNFPTSYGLEGSLLCGAVTVVSVRPCDEHGTALAEV